MSSSTSLSSARTTSSKNVSSSSSNTPQQVVEQIEKVSYVTLIRSSPRHHKWFVALAILQCICIFAERIWLFFLADWSTTEAFREAVYFLVVIGLSALFVAYFAIHSVLQANAFEMAAFFWASIMLLIRLAIEYITRSDECSKGSGNAICAGFLAVSCGIVSVALAFTFTMFRDLEWKRYKAIGAEVGTRRMYRLFELFSAVRKLDMQFSVVTLVTGLVFFWDATPGHADEDALIANCVLFLVEIVWERLGVMGVRNENAVFLYIFWFLSGCLPAFIIFVATDAYQGDRLLQKATDESLKITIAVMAGFAILNRIATVTCSILLYTNFGPNYVGLRRIIMGDRRGKFNRGRQTRYAGESVNTTTTSGSAGAGGGGGSAPISVLGISMKDLRGPSATTTSTATTTTTTKSSADIAVVAIVNTPNPFAAVVVGEQTGSNGNKESRQQVTDWATNQQQEQPQPPSETVINNTSLRALRVETLSRPQ